jgi:hypothetical protein
MHDSRKIGEVMWKDKKSVFMLSTHALPMAFPCEIVEVPRRCGSVKNMIKTSPIHKEYTTYMRGVDVADQLRGSYSCQVRSHKWWHRLFYFLIDTTVVNMWILHKTILKQHDRPKDVLTHFKFIMSLCKSLTKNWGGQKLCVLLLVDDIPRIHCPLKSHLRRRCVLCKKRTNAFCVMCGSRWICYTRGCYEKVHHPMGTF